MAALIEVQKLKNREYQVRVIEGRSESNHCVRMSEDDYQRLLRRQNRRQRTDPTLL